MSGYIDLQVNGFAGVDFNDDSVTRQQIASACDALRDDGAVNVLATVITASIEKMTHRIARVAEAIERDSTIADTIAGIHVEGPFISSEPGYVGAHPAADVHTASRDIAARLIEAGGGHVKLLTLAPEQDHDASVTRWLSDQGIVVAAGHSDASRDELSQSIDAGLRLFTHLGNGCPAQMHRHDNIVQRVLDVGDRIAVSFIADGHHVPLFALKNYFNAMPSKNIVLVSDAISAAGLGPGQHSLSDQTVTVDPNLAAWSADRTHFAGSATSVGQMRSILQDRMNYSEDFIDQVTMANPSRLLIG